MYAELSMREKWLKRSQNDDIAVANNQQLSVEDYMGPYVSMYEGGPIMV